jgi:GTPase SAR1 family protein
LQFGSTKVQLQVWDTAPDFILPARGGHPLQQPSDAHLVLFDVTDRASFKRAASILSHNKREQRALAGAQSRSHSTIVVGTKADKTFHRAVSYEEAQSMVEEALQEATYVEVSSAINTNVDMVFEQVVQQLLDQVQGALKSVNASDEEEAEVRSHQVDGQTPSGDSADAYFPRE